MKTLINTKQRPKLERGGKLAFFAMFVMLFGLQQEHLIDNNVIGIAFIYISSWLFTWAFQIGPCFSLLAKHPWMHKWLYHWCLITSVMMSGVIIILLMGVFFGWWELR